MNTLPKRKGQYVVCRYRGNHNGDLIVGRIDAWRSDVVYITDLLTGKTRKKKPATLQKRNRAVRRSYAYEVVDYHKESRGRDPSGTKDLAVRRGKDEEAAATRQDSSTESTSRVEHARRVFDGLTPIEQRTFLDLVRPVDVAAE